MASTKKRNWTEINECFAKYCETKDVALDWLILSWSEKGVEKQLSKNKYEKYSKRARRYAKQLKKLTND